MQKRQMIDKEYFTRLYNTCCNKEIAQILGIHYNTVASYAKQLGLPRKSRGRVRKININ